MTGSRTWRDRPQHSRIWVELDKLAIRCGHTSRRLPRARWEPLVVVHGGAHGVDRLADGWVAYRRAIGDPPEVVDREVCEAGEGTGAAGLLARDRAMVASKPDVVLAFIAPCVLPGPCRDRRGRAYSDGHGTHGATYAALLALEAGIEVHAWRERPGGRRG